MDHYQFYKKNDKLILDVKGLGSLMVNVQGNTTTLDEAIHTLDAAVATKVGINDETEFYLVQYSDTTKSYLRINIPFHNRVELLVSSVELQSF